MSMVKSVSSYSEHVLFNLILVGRRRRYFETKQRRSFVSVRSPTTISQINITRVCGVEFREIKRIIRRWIVYDDSHFLWQ